MKMKPRSTTLHTRGLLYKRFIGLEKSINLATVYQTTTDGLYWTFDNLEQTFNQITLTSVPTTSTIVQVADFYTILQYQSTYFRYTGLAWETVSATSGDGITLLSATFNNIAKYQTNKYYYVGSFDFSVKGSVTGTTTQYLKGNIMPLSSMNIMHFDDSITLTEDDLVVVEKRLYSVENPEMDVKHQPKDYKIYFATLNSIL